MPITVSWQPNVQATCLNVVGQCREDIRISGNRYRIPRSRVWRGTRCCINSSVPETSKLQNSKSFKEESRFVVPDRSQNDTPLVPNLRDDNLHTRSAPEHNGFITVNEGPLRWFYPQATQTSTSTRDVPPMLYLPGILDGSGWGLNQQHESLTRLFKLRCLEVPIENRISFRSLLEAVESAVIEEAKWRPRGPLYMVGEGFGGAVALAVAARNPDLDLVLILVNPATSFPESPLQSLLPLFYNSPWDHDFVAPLLLNFIVGIKPLSSMPSHQSKQPGFPTSSEVLSKETLLWKLTMLQKAANYANSRLHAVNAQVLVLASGNDHLLRTFSEANRLKELIKGCRTRKFSGKRV